MITEVQRKWLDALRSGEYKRCNGRLHDPHNNVYCALGVACALYKEEFGGRFEGLDFIPKGGRQENGILVDQKVAEWLGLSKSQINSVVFLNDFAHRNDPDFTGIADSIEARLREAR